MQKIKMFLDQVKVIIINLALSFNALPDWQKRLAYHGISFIFAHLALIATGTESIQAFWAIVIGELASFFTWIGKYFAVKAGTNK